MLCYAVLCCAVLCYGYALLPGLLSLWSTCRGWTLSKRRETSAARLWAIADRGVTVAVHCPPRAAAQWTSRASAASAVRSPDSPLLTSPQLTTTTAAVVRAVRPHRLRRTIDLTCEPLPAALPEALHLRSRPLSLLVMGNRSSAQPDLIPPLLIQADVQQDLSNNPPIVPARPSISTTALTQPSAPPLALDLHRPNTALTLDLSSRLFHSSPSPASSPASSPLHHSSPSPPHPSPPPSSIQPPPSRARPLRPARAAPARPPQPLAPLLHLLPPPPQVAALPPQPNRTRGAGPPVHTRTPRFPPPSLLPRPLPRSLTPTLSRPLAGPLAPVVGPRVARRFA